MKEDARPFVFETATCAHVRPDQLDALLESGWRHFGTEFFRYSLALHDNSICGVVPLRVRVGAFRKSKSLRRIWNRNSDLTVSIKPTLVDPALIELFQLHRTRFRENPPDALGDFLSDAPAHVPCENLTVRVSQGEHLLAASFLDLGGNSVSSVYAIFDPRESRRGLGYYTALVEIELATRTGRAFHYLGYAYDVPSHYDYKRRFPGLETYDWTRGWQAVEEPA